MIQETLLSEAKGNENMTIMITGNAGYIGSGVARQLRKSRPILRIFGFDGGYFAHCLTNAKVLPELDYDKQFWGDMRSFPYDILDGVDAVVHLAAISNDPMGNRFEKVTEDINYTASVQLATQAKKYGVRSFVFASSCSIYGSASEEPRREVDSLNPLTAYARSKVATEDALKDLADDGFVVSCLRFATACGMSDRLRLDLVLNDFVACALTTGEITVLSDGRPWRPLIDVKDMVRAIDWAVSRNREPGGAFLAVNIGSESWNYRVKNLASAVASAVSGTQVSINVSAPPDKRSYRVDFSLFKRLAPNHQPLVTLDQSIAELKAGLLAMHFSDAHFRDSHLMRLKVLEHHIANDRLDEELRWCT